jgi:hypothetical protein
MDVTFVQRLFMAITDDLHFSEGMNSMSGA